MWYSPLCAEHLNLQSENRTFFLHVIIHKNQLMYTDTFLQNKDKLRILLKAACQLSTFSKECNHTAWLYPWQRVLSKSGNIYTEIFSWEYF